jgi:hypothetical protein
MLPTTPNRTSAYAIDRKTPGWPTFALQRGLVVAGGEALTADGVYGERTTNAVRRFQRLHNLKVDGVAGSKTQAAIVEVLDRLVHDANPVLPVGLLRGVVETESGGFLGAVNWSVAGGVDCGVVQRRVYGPPFGFEALKAAYAPRTAMQNAAEEFVERIRTFGALPYAKAVPGWAVRCAALAHNWPYAAGQYARYGRLPAPTRIATWVPAGTRFADGTPVRTWDDWARFYALGGSHGAGRVTRYLA